MFSIKYWCLCSLSQQKSLERLLSQEQRYSEYNQECFPQSIGVCAAFHSRRAWSDSFLKSEEIQSITKNVFHKVLVSVQPFTAEELGATPFSRAKRFRVQPRMFSTKYWCLCSLSQQKSLERLLSQERRDSEYNQECFPQSIGVCAAFHSRRAYRNSSKGLEEALLDGVANESAIVDFSSFLFACVTV